MKIQLDTKAMDALFPEGSEARVKLSNAVMQNMADKLVKDFKETQLAVVAKEIANSNGLTSGWGSYTKLTDSAKKAIREESRYFWREKIKEEVLISLNETRDQCIIEMRDQVEKVQSSGKNALAKITARIDVVTNYLASKRAALAELLD